MIRTQLVTPGTDARPNFPGQWGIMFAVEIPYAWMWFGWFWNAGGENDWYVAVGGGVQGPPQGQGVWKKIT